MEETKEEHVEAQVKLPEQKPEEKDNSTSLIDGAVSAAERLEKANAEFAENLNRQEKLDARRRLAGKAQAGEEAKEKTQDEKDQEEADKWLKYED